MCGIDVIRLDLRYIYTVIRSVCIYYIYIYKVRVLRDSICHLRRIFCIECHIPHTLPLMEKHNVFIVHPLEQLGHFLGDTTIINSITTTTINVRRTSSPIRCTSLTQYSRSAAAPTIIPNLHQHVILRDSTNPFLAENHRQQILPASHPPGNKRRATGTAHYHPYPGSSWSTCSAIARRRTACCWSTHWTETGARPVIIRKTHPAPGIHKRRQPGTNGIGEHCGQYGLPQSQRR